MKIRFETPSKAYLEGQFNFDAIRKALSYANTSHAFQLKKLTQNRWFKQKDPQGWAAAVKETKAKINGCLLFEDANGFYVRPGSLPYLVEGGQIDNNAIQAEIGYSFPTPKPFAWKKPLPFALYPYQAESVELLTKIRHGNVELCTSAGKTAIILTLIRNFGQKCIIVTPSASIFQGVLADCIEHFGTALVGGVGDGKKQYGKMITVAISKSLTNLKPGTKEYEHIASCKVMCVDEAHLFGAESLEKVCHGVMADIPYRFFFSGTQTRGDGTLKLLQSIIGKTVRTLLTSEAVKGGYVANHEFRIVPAKSKSAFESGDAIAMKREHALYNKDVNATAARMANVFWTERQESTLILVSELQQISDIVKLLTVPFAYAHGGSGDKDEMKRLGLENPNVKDVVEKFNKGEVRVLVGTSCINTGTNIFPVHHLINLQFGASEVVTKQSVGRALRLLEKSKYSDFHKPKTLSTVWDFDIDVEVLRRHLDSRIEYYRDSGVPIRRL